ncbi:hypothetical protein [Halalkalicoccus salilacus]|uniref:hypothetical protein n=1 Tax=Halalkalicoccus salilacus TaxID=3117459 RepID=UPI00300F261A
MTSTLQTEFEFTLPKGYVDDDGTLHREGLMRLATGADEIQPLQDPRVQSNASYLTIILLSRVVTTLGTVPEVTPPIIEALFVADLAYLQDLYERVNTREADVVDAVCPDCGERFEAQVKSNSDLVAEPEAESKHWDGNGSAGTPTVTEVKAGKGGE